MDAKPSESESIIMMIMNKAANYDHVTLTFAGCSVEFVCQRRSFSAVIGATNLP